MVNHQPQTLAGLFSLLKAVQTLDLPPRPTQQNCSNEDNTPIYLDDKKPQFVNNLKKKTLVTVSDISILSSLGDLFSNNIVFTFIEKENTCHFKKNHYFSETLRYSVLQHCIHTPTLGNSCTASWAFWLKYITPDIFFSPLPDLWGAEHIWKIQTVFLKKGNILIFLLLCLLPFQQNERKICQ